MKKFTTILSLVFITSCMVSSYTTAQAVGYQTNQSRYNNDIAQGESYQKLDRILEDIDAKLINIDKRLDPIERKVSFCKGVGIAWIADATLAFIIILAAAASK